MIKKTLDCDFWLNKDLYNAIMKHREMMIENNEICREYELLHTEDESFQLYFMDFLFKFGYKLINNLEEK